jgi:hypothetical protein
MQGVGIDFSQLRRAPFTVVETALFPSQTSERFYAWTEAIRSTYYPEMTYDEFLNRATCAAAREVATLTSGVDEVAKKLGEWGTVGGGGLLD